MTKDEAKHYIITGVRHQWDNSGWKDIWYDFIDNTILPAIDAKWVDTDSEGNPYELDISSKEKYGTLRVDIYPYFLDINKNEENFLEVKSEFTCIKCGKQPKNSKGEHIIWTSNNYICPYCKACAKSIARDDLLIGYNLVYTNNERRRYEYLKNGRKDLKTIFNKRFAKNILRNNKFDKKIISKDKIEIHNYKWNPDNSISEVK